MQAVWATDVGAVQVLLSVEQVVDAAVGVHRGAAARLDASGEGLGALFDLVDGGDDAEALLSLVQEFFVAVEVGAGHAAAAHEGEVYRFAFGTECHAGSFLLGSRERAGQI